MLEFEMDKQVYNKIDKPNTKSLMQGIKSAIALDVAPKHTGVVIWNGNDLDIRKVAFVGYILWLIYNIYVFTIVGII